jgi:hypothetical protein
MHYCDPPRFPRPTRPGVIVGGFAPYPRASEPEHLADSHAIDPRIVKHHAGNSSAGTCHTGARYARNHGFRRRDTESRRTDELSENPAPSGVKKLLSHSQVIPAWDHHDVLTRTRSQTRTDKPKRPSMTTPNHRSARCRKPLHMAHMAHMALPVAVHPAGYAQVGDSAEIGELRHRCPKMITVSERIKWFCSGDRQRLDDGIGARLEKEWN